MDNINFFTKLRNFCICMTNFSVDRFHSDTVDPIQYKNDPYIESTQTMNTNSFFYLQIPMMMNYHCFIHVCKLISTTVMLTSQIFPLGQYRDQCIM